MYTAWNAPYYMKICINCNYQEVWIDQGTGLSGKAGESYLKSIYLKLHVQAKQTSGDVCMYICTSYTNVFASKSLNLKDQLTMFHPKPWYEEPGKHSGTKFKLASE